VDPTDPPNRSPPDLCRARSYGRLTGRTPSHRRLTGRTTKAPAHR